MRLQVLVIWCVAVSAKCHGLVPPQAQHSNSFASDSRDDVQAQARDSLAVAHYLSRIACTAKRIEKGDFRRFAVVTESSPRCGYRVLVLQVEQDSVRLQAKETINCCYPDVLRWIPLEGLRGRALVVGFGNPVESAVGTLIFGDTGDGRLSTIHHDGKDSCAAAELRNVADRGSPQLVSYHEDPSGGDCDSDCHIAIRERFHLPPNWVRLDRWDGRRWVPAADGKRDFYAKLAHTYHAMDRWLAEDSTAASCRDAYWMTDSTLFRRWAERSDSLASF